MRSSTQISPKIQMKFISSKPHLHNARTHLELFNNKRNGIGRNSLTMCRCFLRFFFSNFSCQCSTWCSIRSKAVTKFKCCAQMTCSRSLTREIFPNAPATAESSRCAELNTVYTEDDVLSIVKEYLTHSSSSSFLLLFRCEFVGTFHTAVCNSFRISHGG